MTNGTKATELLESLDLFLRKQTGGVPSLTGVTIERDAGGRYHVTSDGVPRRASGQSLEAALSNFLSST